MAVLILHYELLLEAYEKAPEVNLRPVAIDNLMFDIRKKCGIILTQDDHSAVALRNLLITKLKVSPRLSLTVKEDYVHPVLSAVLPRMYSVLPEGAVTQGFRMRNTLLKGELLEIVKVVPMGKTTKYFFVTSFEMLRKIGKRPRTFPMVFGSLEFSAAVTYIKATPDELPKWFLFKQQKSKGNKSPPPLPAESASQRMPPPPPPPAPPQDPAQETTAKIPVVQKTEGDRLMEDTDPFEGSDSEWDEAFLGEGTDEAQDPKGVV